MDNIDQLLKEYMSNKALSGRSRGLFEPDESLWHRFFDNSLSEDEAGQMADYLSKDNEAREFALRTRLVLAEADGRMPQAPSAWVDSAKKLAVTKALKGKKKSYFMLWYGIAAIAFGLSFFMPRHYMQFLVLTLLAGAKAIADQRQARMQIMIYQALESGKEINSERLKELGIKK